MNKVSIIGLYIKVNLARQKLLEITTKVGKGHLGGSLSCIDILTGSYSFNSPDYCLYINSKMVCKRIN